MQTFAYIIIIMPTSVELKCVLSITEKEKIMKADLQLDCDIRTRRITHDTISYTASLIYKTNAGENFQKL